MKRIKDYTKNRPLLGAVFLLAGLLALPACSTAPLDLEYYAAAKESPRRFYVCHGYGCHTKTRTRLNKEEWLQVQQPLKQQSSSAEEERTQIAQSIALIEQITGKKVGTDKDTAGATFLGHGQYQLDCIDEAINSSLYLKFFEEAELLKWHDVDGPARRGAFFDGEWPHNTAVVKEKETGKQYAVDSWFSANGEDPHIVPLGLWLGGWRPEGS